MMSLRKLVWVAVTLVVTAGVVSADPMRTVFTKENKFPGVWGTEVSIGSGGTYYDDDDNSFNDVDTFQITPAVRFGVTERLALSAKVPYVGYSSGNVEDEGLGDIALGLDFLFFEDIFEYAWILPHAEVALSLIHISYPRSRIRPSLILSLPRRRTWPNVMRYTAQVFPQCAVRCKGCLLYTSRCV